MKEEKIDNEDIGLSASYYLPLIYGTYLYSLRYKTIVLILGDEGATCFFKGNVDQLLCYLKKNKIPETKY